MFQRILTEKERRQANLYIKNDGAKDSIVRSLASRGRVHLPRIEQDLALLKQLLKIYEKHRRVK